MDLSNTLLSHIYNLLFSSGALIIVSILVLIFFSVKKIRNTRYMGIYLLAKKILLFASIFSVVFLIVLIIISRNEIEESDIDTDKIIQKALDENNYTEIKTDTILSFNEISIILPGSGKLMLSNNVAYYKSIDSGRVLFILSMTYINIPKGISLDSLANLYISDFENKSDKGMTYRILPTNDLPTIKKTNRIIQKKILVQYPDNKEILNVLYIFSFKQKLYILKFDDFSNSEESFHVIKRILSSINT